MLLRKIGHMVHLGSVKHSFHLVLSFRNFVSALILPYEYLYCDCREIIHARKARAIIIGKISTVSFGGMASQSSINQK